MIKVSGHSTFSGKGGGLRFQFQSSKVVIIKVGGHILQWPSQQEQVHPHQAYGA